MNARKIALSAAGLATVAAAVTGGVGASMAYADASEASAGATSSSSSSQDSSSATDSSMSTDSSSPERFGKHNHTEVTGDEATKVTDAVKAQDANFAAEKVLKDEDGSYDVIGKSGDDFVKYDVSADLQTITKDDRGPGRGGPGGGGPGFDHEEVTGDEATKVTDAVTAKDSSVTVEKVFKHEDGSYIVAGTEADERIMFKVSSDLGTVEELEKPDRSDRGDHPGGPGGRGGFEHSEGSEPSEDSGSSENSSSEESDGSSDQQNQNGSESSSDNNADTSFFSGVSTSTGA